MEPDLKIEDIDKSVINYFFKEKLLWTVIASIVIIAFELFFLPVIFRNLHDPEAIRILPVVIVIPLIFIISQLSRIFVRYQKAFLQQFAAANNFTYTDSQAIEDTHSTLFQLEGKQPPTNIVSGSYHGVPLQIFLYERIIQMGRSSQIYDNTVFRLEFAAQLPQLYLHHNRPLLSNEIVDSLDKIADSFPGRQKLSLEGEFGKRFTLFYNPEAQIDALQVFTPDIMQLILDSKQHLDIEIVANHAYIYTANHISKRVELETIFLLGQKLIDKLSHSARIMNAPSNQGTAALPMSAAGRVARQRKLRLVLYYGLAIGAVVAGITLSLLVY